MEGIQGTDLPVQFGGKVKDFDGKQYVKPRKSIKVMCREIQIGYTAATLALDEAGIAKGTVDPDRIGVVFGSEMLNCDLVELSAGYRKCVVDGEIHADLWGASAMSDLYPLWMLKYLPNMTACHVAIAVDARGPNNSITLDEASSLLALIEAASVIERGHTDVMVAGGCGTRAEIGRLMYRGDQLFSHRSDDPEAASRPFDLNRDGGVVGEGAGAFVLESREHAEARGAKILARIVGWGRGFEACPDQLPGKGDNIRASIASSLETTGLKAADIGHVNAHGSSQVVRDRIEAQAIADCLGDVPVTAPKSFFGCLAAGTGAVEMAASVMGIEKGAVPFTLNYETPDPDCPINVIHGQSMPITNPTAMILSHADMGQAVSVIITAA